MRILKCFAPGKLLATIGQEYGQTSTQSAFGSTVLTSTRVTFSSSKTLGVERVSLPWVLHRGRIRKPGNPTNTYQQNTRPEGRLHDAEVSPIRRLYMRTTTAWLKTRLVLGLED